MRTLFLGLWLVACQRDKDETTDSRSPTGDTAGSDTNTGTDTDTDTETIETFEAVVECPGEVPAPPAGEVCGVVGDPATATHVVVEGDILGDRQSFLGGRVVMSRGDNGLITCAGCGCAVPTDALVVSCPDAVVSPGLINGHDHLSFTLNAPGDWETERFQHRHDWRLGLNGHTEIGAPSTSGAEVVLYGEIRMALSGVTSIAGSSSAAGVVRNLDDSADNGGLGGWQVDYSTFPLGDSSGILRDSGCEDYSPDGDFVLDSRIYLPHVAEGINAAANNEFQCLAGLDPTGVDLVADNTSIIHGIALTADDVAEMSRAGAHLVWSPRSNISLYGETAPVTVYHALGVPIALGTDWTPSGSATILRELQCADQLNASSYGSYFTDRELWLMVTRDAAAAMGASGQLGSLRPGFVGDVAIFAKSGRDLHRAVIDASITDVQLVLRGSEPLTGDADLVGGLLGAEASACEALDDCVSDHVVCVDEGKTLAGILSVAGVSAYDLTICDVPADEPTCDPLRQEAGEPVSFPAAAGTDADGDGAADAEDNCPSVFNPGTPLDGFAQADADADGLGDACDACPLEGAGPCDWRDPDGDGLEGLDDNCPATPNQDQADADGDVIGDACDPCPDFRGPTGSCPVPVYDVKDGTVADGESVALEHMLVTGVGAVGVFLQLDPADPAWNGPDYSGIYVYMPTVDKPERGDVITIEGTVAEFFGQIQLSEVTGWSLESWGHADPAPEPVTPADVATGGARASALEAVVVQVEDVTVTELGLSPGTGDSSPTQEFEVDDQLAVNDFLYLASPYPVLGEAFASISGVLRYANDASKLEPRDTFDLVAGLPTIVSLDPEIAYVEVGVTDPSAFTVTLARPAAADQSVTITCAPGGVASCPPSVLVAAGSLSATVEVGGVSADPAPVVVTATLNGSLEVGEVFVYDDSSERAVVAVEPDPVEVEPYAVEQLTVVLSLPAPSAGASVDLASASGFVTVPVSVVVPAGALAATFDVTAGGVEGVDTVTASLGTSAAEATVEVRIDPGIGVLFSEYLEGSTGNNKFVEIKNVEPGDFDLTGCEVNVYSNGSLTPTSIALDTFVLGPDEVYLLCHSAATFATFAPCDQTSGSLNFNGDDAVELACDGVTYDVIGQIGFDPGSTWGVAPTGTQDSVLKRDCDLEIGDADGSNVFDPSVEWIGGTKDDASDLGNDHCN